ncbi:MAG: hypothetical protein GEU79_07365 [Acidimicrobiia bacterium]|nr:hypothetical protein [Acidimicrobiia bacterium]
MVQSEYVPGVCNIGPEEIARRRNAGWVGLAVTVVAFAILVWTDVNPWWRLLLFLPAALSASGFLQGHFRFCAGFSRAGVFNFGPVGQTHEVTDDESKAQDRRRGNQISLYSAIIGVVVATIATVIG